MRTDGEHDSWVPASSARVCAIPAESRDHFTRRPVARASGIFHRRMCAGNGSLHAPRSLLSSESAAAVLPSRRNYRPRPQRCGRYAQVYRLADVPRSITWDEVRRTLEAVDRRTIRGRRDYAILLFLVTYGLRAHEVAKLTLEDIDWKRERFQVPDRKAGHATAYPLAAVSILRQSRRLYGCWPLEGAFSQPLKATATATAM